METPPLAVQSQSDTDELIANRIQLIYKQFDGGLAEFFDRLQKERSEKETPSFILNDRCFGLSQVAMGGETPDSGDY